jgi:pimeloyl-ACP methyl ester carboxylesterase
MKLELLQQSATVSPAKGSVLLLHGACFGAWCWKENLMPWFSQQGYDVFSMSLRNHGRSEKKGSLKFRRIREYVEDLTTVVNQLNGPLYLVGHSMGGFIIQHYLSKQPAATVKKAVLLCSIPPTGAWRITLKTLLFHPLTFLKANLTWSLAPIFTHPQRARKFMFSPTFPEERFQQVLEQIQDESYLGYLDTLFLHLPHPEKVTTPVMVIGGEKDYLFPPSDVHVTAQAYHTNALLVKDAAHNFFMEDGWEDVAVKMEEFFGAEKEER